jgi:hypothetical protein
MCAHAFLFKCKTDADVTCHLGGKKKESATKPQTTFDLDSTLKLGKSCQEEHRSKSWQAKNPYTENMVELGNQRISNLTQEINILEDERMQQSEIIASLKNQVFLGLFFLFLHVFGYHY